MIKVKFKLSEDTISAYKKMCDLARKCQSKLKGKGGKKMAPFGSFAGKLAALGVDIGSEPSFSSSVLYDEKSGLYLPVSSVYALSPGAAKNISDAATTSNLPPVTPWSLGVAMMAMDLANTGFYSKRLAEYMYLVNRVFEHNLAVRARQHGMRVR